MVVCAHESLTLMAVGFKDGTVVTVKGNLTRDRISTMKVVHSEPTPGVYVTGEPLSLSLLPCSFSHVYFSLSVRPGVQTG